MSQIQRIQTEYGDLEIKTVTCDSCGNTVPKKDAREFVICDEVHHRSRTSKIKNIHASGHVCQYCQESPVAFPRAPSVLNQMARKVFTDRNGTLSFAGVMTAVLSALLTLMSLFAGILYISHFLS